MNETVRRANFALFRQMIAGEQDEVRRHALERELDEEEARFEAALVIFAPLVPQQPGQGRRIRRP